MAAVVALLSVIGVKRESLVALAIRVVHVDIVNTSALGPVSHGGYIRM